MLIPIWHIYRILGGITGLYTGNMMQETGEKTYKTLLWFTECNRMETKILTTASSGLHV